MKRSIGLVMSVVAIGATLGGCRMAPPAERAVRANGQAQKVQQAVAQSQSFDRAIAALLEAASSEDPFIRANATEAMQQVPQRALPLAQRGLSDTHPAVRFAAVVTAGMLDFKSLRPAIRPLMQDDNSSVRAAAVYALSRMGEKVDLTPLAQMLTSQDPGLRANVAMILGLLGDKSAVPLLQNTVSAPMPRASASSAAVVRIQVAEAIVKLGDDSELNALRAGAYNQFDEVRLVAIMAMGAVGDQRMVPGLRKFLVKEPIEIQLAAASSLARLGQLDGLAVTLAALEQDNQIVRAQAAWGLGWFDDPKANAALERLLADSSEQVRVAAAAALVRRLSGTPRGGQ